ncbi:MAG: hypothetical protein ACOCQD_01155 [archaeon]
MGSVNTLIDSYKLNELLTKEKKSPFLDMKGRFRIFEKPKNGCQYVLGVDSAKGTGEHYSTIQVLRVDSIKPIKVEQVATFECNKTDLYHFANIVNRVSIYYNHAYIMAENNAEGWTVVSELHWNYENGGLINTGNKTTDLGIRAKRGTKDNAVILMRKVIEGGLIELHDERTITQLTDFTEKRNGTYSCENLNDDLVTGLY